MTITLRVEKGAPLTIEELDGNITDLDGRTVALEEGQQTFRSIEEITQSGNSITVVYTDSTTDGPFTFEVLLRYRGDWAASTAYAQNDLVRANGVIYFVAVSHVSDLTFDPGATSGSDGDIYIPFLDIPELSLPVGGDEGYILAKASSSDYDLEWRNSGVPAGGDQGYVLTKVSGTDYDVAWGAAAAAPVLTLTADTFSMDSLEYSGVYFRSTNTDGCTVTIPANADVAFPTGTEVHFRQSTINGWVLIEGASDSDGPVVTINGIAGFLNETNVEGAVITVKKISANIWDLFGLLAPESSSDTSA